MGSQPECVVTHLRVYLNSTCWALERTRPALHGWPYHAPDSWLNALGVAKPSVVRLRNVTARNSLHRRSGRGLANYGAALRAWPSASLEAGGAARAGKAGAKAAVDAAAGGGAAVGGGGVAVPGAHNVEGHIAVVAGTGEEVGVIDARALWALVGLVALLQLRLQVLRE